MVVKVTERYDYLYFDIARAGSKPERRQVKLRQLKELSGNSQPSGGTAVALLRQLLELAQQGYGLTTTYERAGAPTTLVFTKKQ